MDSDSLRIHPEDMDLPPGRTVATRMDTDRAHVNLLLQLLVRGCTVFPLNPRLPSGRLRHTLLSAGCTTIIARQGLLHMQGIHRYHADKLRDWSRAPFIIEDLAQCSLTKPALLVLTSGSSGDPKAAVLSLGNFKAAAEYSARNIPLGPGDGWLLSLPLFHVAGLGIVFRCLYSDAKVIYPASGESLLQSIQRPEVTHVSLVATQLYRLLREPGGMEALRRLKAILCGGSAMPPALMEEASDAGLPLHTSYGMTETTAQITATAPGDGIEAWRSSGRPLCDGTVQISTEGEICVRGKTLFLGYEQRRSLKPPLDEEGWFHTGDMGHFDSEGRLHVTGRIGNRFVSGGENVQPEDIERAVLALPGVLRARAVPIPHPEYVHVPAVFLDQQGADIPELESLRNALRDTLPPHALPRYVFAWPAHLERDGEKLSNAKLIEEATQMAC